MSGARVAVIGAGVSGWAVAAALAQGARARGGRLEVRVYGGARRPFHAPVLLTRECRARLAALGCPVPAGACSLPGVEVSFGPVSQRLPAGTQGLWAVAREALVHELAASAVREGARFIARRVDAVQRDERPEGRWVLRSQGSIDRFDRVVIATGTAHGLLSTRSPPSLPAIAACLTPRLFRGSEYVKLLLSPCPGVAGLYLTPGERAVHALGFGPAITEIDLCQALMAASRDGHLPIGFAIDEVRSARLPAGAGRSLHKSGVLAVGPAALGHPLQLDLSAALASCSRVAAAMLDSMGNQDALPALVRDGVSELVEAARFGTAAIRWLIRAKARAPAAVAQARGRDRPGCSGGVLGLASPTPLALLRTARRAGLAEVARSLVFVAEGPPAPPGPAPEPRLVYLVEDDDALREALTCFLRHKGAEVMAFSDELSLYAAVAARPPAAIVLDVVLRRVDGLRLCAGLKHHPIGRDVRVLVTSGLDRPHVREQALAAGAVAFLPKPVDPALLWATLATPAPGVEGPSTSLRYARGER